VPDFVGDILNGVNEFLSGGVDDLGDAVTDVAGGENASDGDGGTDEGGA
jgi:hypothetical protein